MGLFSPPGWTRIFRENAAAIFAIPWFKLRRLLSGKGGRGKQIYLLYDGDTLVHYCFLMSDSGRVRRMDGQSLEIGPYWTAPAWRGKGLATYTVGRIRHEYPETSLFILARVKNPLSMQVAVKNGFARVALCERRRRLFCARYVETTEPDKDFIRQDMSS